VSQTVIDWECYERPDGEFLLMRSFIFPGCGHKSTKVDVLTSTWELQEGAFYWLGHYFSDPRGEIIKNQYCYRGVCSVCGLEAPVSRHHFREIYIPSIDGLKGFSVYMMVRQRGNISRRIDIRTFKEICHEKDPSEANLEACHGAEHRPIKARVDGQDAILAGIQASVSGHQKTI
jgi:hypothetical protein